MRGLILLYSSPFASLYLYSDCPYAVDGALAAGRGFDDFIEAGASSRISSGSSMSRSRSRSSPPSAVSGRIGDVGDRGD